MQEPSESHWNATKKVIGYIHEIKDFALLYKKNKNFTLVSYSSEDFASDIDERISTS
jgi:hypothetical protein